MLEKESLMQEAIKAREKSYSPYSHFAVGAAIECKDGTIFHGANVENASYGLCMCAERNALYNAYMHGYHKEDFVQMALVGDSSHIVSPCGACRQVLAELFPMDALLYMGTISGLRQESSVQELLPYAFDKENL